MPAGPCANPNLAMDDGSTPLMAAAEKGSYAIVERFIKAGAKLDARKVDGTTALLVAQRSSNTAIVNQLKQAGNELAPARSDDYAREVDRRVSEPH